MAKVEIAAGTSSNAVPATAVTIAASARRPTRLFARQQPRAKTPKIARMVPAVLPKMWLNWYEPELTNRAQASGSFSWSGCGSSVDQAVTSAETGRAHSPARIQWLMFFEFTLHSSGTR